jgi:hypothetical protein
MNLHQTPSYLLNLHHAEDNEHAAVVVDPNVTPVDPAQVVPVVDPTQAVPATPAVNLLGRKHQDNN